MIVVTFATLYHIFIAHKEMNIEIQIEEKIATKVVKLAKSCSRCALRGFPAINFAMKLLPTCKKLAISGTKIPPWGYHRPAAGSRVLQCEVYAEIPFQILFWVYAAFIK